MRPTNLDWKLLAAGLATLVIGACGDGSGGSGSTCSAGATLACVCAGGASGVQECAADGSRWLTCDCTGSVGPDGGTTPDGGGGNADGFVPIAPGSFTMGSPAGEDGRYNDETQHEVTLTRGFYLQATEVTQEQWKARMDNNPSAFAACGDDCPVEEVNWWEALAYANAVSSANDLPECYTLEGCNDVSPGNDLECAAVTVNAPGGNPYGCPGYRLPTEAEWEYAYRAGTTTAFYNGGITDTGCDDPNLGAIGWYCGNSGDTTHPVAQKAPNAWGLYDMAGNVWEWAWDWYGSDPGGSATDPTGPGTGSDRVVRGGSWDFDAVNARAAVRFGDSPVDRLGNLGFRLARSAP